MRELSCLPLGVCALLLTLPACDKPQTCGGEATNCVDPESESGSESSGDGDGDASGDGDGDGLSPCWTELPIVVLETNFGTMVAQLDGSRAPITVQNFIRYVDEGFYDGTIFHRVIEGFVIQGGGFLPGMVEKEPTMNPIPLEIHPELRHIDGALSMARTSDPNSATSQFYVTDVARPDLDDSYAVFGVLIDGFEVRDMISSVPTTSTTWMDVPLDDVPVDDVLLEAAYCVEQWP